MDLITIPGKNKMSDTVQVSFSINRDIFSALRQDPEHFVPELRLAAAVKWYELGIVSQSKAAEIAGLSRSDFIAELTRFKVSPFQYSADEIAREVDS
jgi:predicted HTH domain antitoxin